jgi:hypothetical protein
MNKIIYKDMPILIRDCNSNVKHLCQLLNINLSCDIYDLINIISNMLEGLKFK